MTLFGDTREDQVRSAKLLAGVAILWPIILLALLAERLGIPCTRST